MSSDKECCFKSKASNYFRSIFLLFLKSMHELCTISPGKALSKQKKINFAFTLTLNLLFSLK